MTAGLSTTGFEAKALADIQDEITVAIQAAISPTLNLSATSLLGQFVGTTSSQIRQTWEAAQAVYASRDVDQATGAALTELCALTGTVRRGETYSTVLMTVTLAAGTYPAGSLIVYPVGSPADLFDNDEEIVTAGATLTGQAFTAQEPGPVRANAATLTVISNPVVGFSAPTNPAEAILGEVEESDAALRGRQRLELARRGSHTVDAIRTDLSDALPTSTVVVFENDTDSTVDGIPAHAIECLIQVGSETDAEIAAAIFAAKPAGIRAYGTTTDTVTDDQGNDHTIGWTEPDEITIYIDLAVSVLSGTYAGDTILKSTITDWCDANLGVGKDVLKARIESLCMGVAGVVDVTAEIGLSAGAGTSAANYVIAAREIAIVNQANIAITQTIVTGAP
jgi:uncharacterized phage protein gp47/JayE